MSVLRKKMNLEAGIPDIVKERVDVWKALHLAISDQISGLTGLTWTPSKKHLSRGTLKALLSSYPDVGLTYSYRASDGRFPAFAHFDKDFSAYVTSSSLGLELADDIAAYQPEMLDLILFQPVKEQLGTSVATLLNATTPTRVRFTPLTQGLSVSSLSSPREPGAWNEIKFDIKLNPPEPDPDKDEAAFKPCTLSFSLLLSESVMHNIASQAWVDGVNGTEDGVGPWADKIYKSLETAVVPIRAVIESCNMTVAECTRLEIDDVIALPGISLQSVSLETEMNKEPVKIGTAALGIYKSNRALKLSGDIEKGVFVAAQFSGEDAIDVSQG